MCALVRSGTAGSRCVSMGKPLASVWKTQEYENIVKRCKFSWESAQARRKIAGHLRQSAASYRNEEVEQTGYGHARKSDR